MRPNEITSNMGKWGMITDQGDNELVMGNMEKQRE